MTSGCGRLARMLPPGPWHYIAVCEEHRWIGMSWKGRKMALAELKDHRDNFDEVVFVLTPKHGRVTDDA